MKPMTVALFDQWLAAYSRASAENDPQASARLFSEDACYYESPFDEPLVGRQAIYDYWAAGAVNLADKCSSHEVLAVRGNLGIARWQGRFVVRANDVIMSLDCIFLAQFNAQGECSLFREWWHGAAMPPMGEDR